MRRILLARHGETSWNALGRLQGHTDIELSEVGYSQARELAARITRVGISAVWTSDLSRAKQTGAVVATSLGLPRPSEDHELRERAFGVFEGLTRGEIASRYPEAWQAWLDRTEAPPGGESRELACARLTRALSRIVSASSEPALVVTHGGVMRLWLMETLGESIGPIANGATYVVEHTGVVFRARLFDDRA